MDKFEKFQVISCEIKLLLDLTLSYPPCITIATQISNLVLAFSKYFSHRLRHLETISTVVGEGCVTLFQIVEEYFVHY